ncbi:MAG: M20/M25/M40 family metallo-hydrolase [Desulfobacterales bacterium]|nr:M20/M25/M40 family metallo-hydrolase [Desulfobacterales bacterium]
MRGPLYSSAEICQPDIQAERLADTFKTLVQIDSISREEGRLCRELRRRLDELGFNTVMDEAGARVNGDSGNLIAHWPGNVSAEPLLLSAHMDTVEPGRGVQVRYEAGIFSSAGDTILGSDDKSALAIILEVLHCIRDNNLPCGPLEVVFTICEEIGLLGAKHLAYQHLAARAGYVLDTRNPEDIVTRAPSANRFTFRVHGKAAHAGAAPEKGINAIALAAKAIAQLKLGRIDHETTCNIGVIEGGVATNIVPDRVVVHGEARSHDEAKLRRVTEELVAAFKAAVDGEQIQGEERPWVEVAVEHDFARLHIPDDHYVVQLAVQSAQALGHGMSTVRSGGGSDANVFAAHGIVTGVLGTGMENVHTVKETIRLSDMVRSARLLLRIVLNHTQYGRSTANHGFISSH